MAFSFYWHDYETFGVDPSRDWPCQFAGVRTDADLNPIGEPLMIYCKPPADYLPRPGACLVTGITPQLARAKGLSEPAFIARIHAELAQPYTCGVGYNSIRFDDEITRYGFYRNFYEPYAREWQNNCSRWDIIDVVRMVHALRPDGINWPTTETGQVSFRLELLTKANELGHDAAHDALSDVYATIALAKLIKTKKPKLFDYALSLRHKKNVLAQIDLLESTPFLHISSKYPASQACCALVMPIGRHPTNSNGIVVIDLSQNPEQWQHASVGEIQRRLYTTQADLGDEARIALKTIHINKSPMVATVKLLDDTIAARLGIDLAQCRQHWQQIKKLDRSALQRLLDASETTFDAPRDVDQKLYDGFFDDADKALMTRVRNTKPEQLVADNFAFSDARLAELLFRYKARNWPESLDEDEFGVWQDHCFSRLCEASETNPYVMDNFAEELHSLMQDSSRSERERELLMALQAYGDSLVSGELFDIDGDNV